MDEQSDSFCPVYNYPRASDSRNQPSPDERSLLVLKALVEAQIESGRPVPISLLLDHAEATINSEAIEEDLALLESDRLVERADGTDGRVPTLQSYLWYRDRFRRRRRGSGSTRTRRGSGSKALGWFAGVFLVVLASVSGGLLSGGELPLLWIVFLSPVAFVVGIVLLVVTRRQIGGFLRGMGCSFVIIGAILFLGFLVVINSPSYWYS